LQLEIFDQPGVDSSTLSTGLCFWKEIYGPMIKIKGQNTTSKSTANSHPHPSTNERSEVHAKNLAFICSKHTRSADLVLSLTIENFSTLL